MTVLWHGLRLSSGGYVPSSALTLVHGYGAAETIPTTGTFLTVTVSMKSLLR